MQRLVATPLLLLVALGLQGCIGFSGPNHVRNAIVKQQDVKLDKEMGIDVGPLGIALANTIAAAYSPVTLDGLWSVSFGEYHIRPTNKCALDEFNLDRVELDGWKPFVRVRERGSTVKLMHNARGNNVNKMLFMTQDGDELVIVQAEGDFNKIIANLLESELLDHVDFLRDLEEPEYDDRVFADAAPEIDGGQVAAPARGVRSVGPSYW